MSLATWKKEFYKTGAQTKSATKSVVSALNHSIRKWNGLSKTQLKKHGLKREVGTVYQRDKFGVFEASFEVTTDTCALCQLQLGKAKGDKDLMCNDCPLTLVFGHPCDGDDSPYGAFTLRGSVRPMLTGLKTALKEAVSAR